MAGTDDSNRPTANGQLAEIEAIARLKYAYLRLLDLKAFDELGMLLTEDATATYEDGRRSYDGRDAIVGFLHQALDDHGMVTQHQCHHPEIRLTAPDAASGTWYLTDRVIIAEVDLEIGGAAFYQDEYRKVDGGWRISHTGYERLFEERRKHSSLELVAFRSRFDLPPKVPEGR